MSSNAARNWHYSIVISGGLYLLDAFILVISLLLALEAALVQAGHHGVRLNVNALSDALPHRGGWQSWLLFSFQLLGGCSRHLGCNTSHGFLKLIVYIIDQLSKLLVNSLKLLYLFIGPFLVLLSRIEFLRLRRFKFVKFSPKFFKFQLNVIKTIP